MATTFRYAGLHEYPRIASFIDDHWQKDHVYSRMPPLFDWTFGRTSHWDAEGYSVALAEDGEELVGILGGIPFSFNRFGSESRGIWIVNYVIRPDHRRGATALQLLSMFRQSSFDAVVAFGINPATSNIYRVLRGQVLPHIPRHFVILPGAADRLLYLLHLNYPSWDNARLKALAEYFQLDGLFEPPSFSESELPLNWDEETWRALAARTVGAARDSEYIRWRYVRHPCLHYRFIAVPGEEGTGFAVWRLETIRYQQPDGSLADVDRIGRLVEFLPVSANNARDLVAVFLQELSATGALGADYYGYHGCSRIWILNAGLRMVEDHPDGLALPSRFQPLDGQGGEIFGALFAPDGTPACSAALDCPWYWTKSDSDQDRPN